MSSETMVPATAAGDLLARLAGECREADARLMGLARQVRDLADALPPGVMAGRGGPSAALAIAAHRVREALGEIETARRHLARPEGEANG